MKLRGSWRDAGKGSGRANTAIRTGHIHYNEDGPQWLAVEVLVLPPPDAGDRSGYRRSDMKAVTFQGLRPGIVEYL